MAGDWWKQGSARKGASRQVLHGCRQLVP